MSLFPLLLLLSLVFLDITRGHVLPIIKQELNTTDDPNRALFRPTLFHRDSSDPADFSWIKRWAAIGDSYTAGIGSGRQLGGIFHRQRDWFCSRYDTAYPMIANQAFGSAVDDFQFAACSGDRSVQIYQQVLDMKGSLDLVMMTAGGNDLCLASLLKTCVFLPFQGEDKCQAIIDKAQSNIDTILKPNIQQILDALNNKMNKGSIVVYNGYAQFFNTDNDACETEQNWTVMSKWFFKGLALTVDRRKRFNNLVIGINNAIKDVVDEYANKSNLNFKIDFANWDRWPQEGVDGQFCHPSSSGHYPDSSQPALQFFKTDTYVAPLAHDELKRRGLDEEEEAEFQAFVDKLNQEDIYDTLLYKSPDPRAEALHKLDPRAPSPPSCPGDGSFDPTLGLGLPDTYGKLFHPNELGHATIASYALQTVMDVRADVLGIKSPVCDNTDRFTCYRKQGRKAFAGVDVMNDNYKDFCATLVPPSNTKGWTRSKTYHKDTPDEHTFTITLGDAMDYSKQQCLESMNHIINGCDTDDSDNPLKWKFGGSWQRGEYTYEIAPKRENRPWPLSSTWGHCWGWYKVLFGAYELYGAGWATHDWGQQTLLSSAKSCVGGGVTGWVFEYFDPPQYGMEWKANFNTPIWVRGRCFKNDKVQKGAGGYTNGCAGND